MTPAVAVAIGLALIQYLVSVVATGRARVRHGIRAPAIQGHPLFERQFRVQQNNLEQLILFVPAILMFGQFVNGGSLAFALGLLFVAGRALYMRDYVADPERRARGFLIASIASGTLLFGGIIGSAAAMLR